MQMPVFPLYVEDLLPPGMNAAFHTGIGFAVVAGCTLLTAPFLGKVSAAIGLKRCLILALAITGISLALHPAAHDIPQMLLIRALLGIGAAGIQPSLHAMISREAPEGMRGGITGYANSASILGFFAGPLGAGWMASRFGTPAIFYISGAILLGCAVGAALIAKRRGGAREIVPIPTPAP
jgi:MFS family permease